MKTYGPLPFKLFLSILFRRVNCPECGISHSQCVRLSAPRELIWFAPLANTTSLIPVGLGLKDILRFPGIGFELVFGLVTAVMIAAIVIMNYSFYKEINCIASE